ncbi:hypothetical protein [Falsiroseomonas sp. E2-1-a4]|uniref:hypothetical protein n=1 Tax=Falsiroseomonas sp. E2-1-a4 TaxID=3239299 RepID=UPI003F33FE82
MSGRHSTEAAREPETPITPRRVEYSAPRLVEPATPQHVEPAAPRRRDPFAHGELPQRPNYLPEEAEAVGSRSEIWATLKGLALAAAAILFAGWLLTAS